MAEVSEVNAAAIAEVIAAEELRCKAVTEDQFDVVRELVGDELWYRHSSGRLEDKAAYLASLEAGHRSFTREPLEVRIYGDVAVVLGGYAIVSDSQDGVSPPRRSSADGLQVWIKREERWQLVAHLGATKVPGV